MAEEIKTNVGQTGTDGQAEVKPTRSEVRHEDLVNTIKEQEGKHTLEMEAEKKARLEAEAKAKDATFRADFIEQTSKYPEAPNYKDAIKTQTERGLSVEEATILVLQRAGKLTTQVESHRAQADSDSTGGSSVTASPTGDRDPGTMEQAERRAELIKLEADGKFGIRDGGIFLS